MIANADPRPASNGARQRLLASGFALVAACILGGGALLAQRLGSLDSPDAVALGLTLDLVLTLPAAWYLLVVRPRRWPTASVIPAVVAGLLVARLVLPGDQQLVLRKLELALVPLELTVVTLVALRLRRILRAASDPGRDTLGAIEQASGELVPARLPAALVATELAVAHYGLFAWRAAPHVPSGNTALSVHRRSNHGPILVAVSLAVLTETLAVHFLVARWSPAVAWVLSLASAYGGLWLLADYRATVLRPWLVSRDAIEVRAGLRWRARIPRANLARLQRERPSEGGLRALSTTLATDPTRWLVLCAPLEVRGPYGLVREVDAIGVTPDDAHVLEGWLAEGSTAAQGDPTPGPVGEPAHDQEPGAE